MILVVITNSADSEDPPLPTKPIDKLPPSPAPPTPIPPRPLPEQIGVTPFQGYLGDLSLLAARHRNAAMEAANRAKRGE
jgi:hypothetical protein